MRISDWSSDVCSSDLTLTLSADGTFDTFNPFNAKGTAGAGGTIAVETLMVNGDDEAFTMYGLLAETIEWPEDRSWIIFHLNPQARWPDANRSEARRVGNECFRTFSSRCSPFP